MIMPNSRNFEMILSSILFSHKTFLKTPFTRLFSTASNNTPKSSSLNFAIILTDCDFFQFLGTIGT